ncbi:MAG: OmpA family protein [Polyangiaceae bacterium]|nr:OmpA family protein [Polyangiaceae bacterium]
MRMRLRHLAPLVLALPLAVAATGCVSGNKAKPRAASRSGCETKNISVVKQDGHDLVLDVCGTHEKWGWYALGGWMYDGPAGVQPAAAPKDDDGDGITNELDACPAKAGPANAADPRKHGCPPATDSDGDGVPDEGDACPNAKGAPSTDLTTTGCPDKDGDGIVDKLDACVEVAGIASTDPTKNGCPPPAPEVPKDGDGDTILDTEDACPTDPGKADPDPAKNGCPLVVVRGTEIVIMEQVQFALGLATIRKESDGLLDNVAAVMTAHPEILKIEVQGHTDSQGSPARNKILSQARAEAVRVALVKRKIDAARLTAKGYGQDQPIADNTTPEGQQKNRRVQFLIVEKKPAEPTP